MNDRIIAFELPDGTVRYATCAAKQKRPGETTQQWLLRAFNKLKRDNPELTDAVRITDPLHPDGVPLEPGQRKVFRGAWRHAGGGQIVIDMPEARKLKLAEIRAERDRRFAPLDAEWMKATGQGRTTDADAIEAKRQTLRDLPRTVGPHLDAIADAETLAAFAPGWP